MTYNIDMDNPFLTIMYLRMCSHFLKKSLMEIFCVVFIKKGDEVLMLRTKDRKSKNANTKIDAVSLYYSYVT